ncbi:helix-turn-helix transcriptional regulator [uncultured Chryseobacterium sp.]|uniref:helix-turn-helix domain-containing protein n=1 Tax=uncultured Chryseobacterium sp. TaxID=259322 RepID=UPI0025FC42F5|nr:helix-turn-helix transcriptional regulator [uncultured Chryseobacterium sp.]
MQDRKIHQGRNIKRFREMLGIKQEALAFDLGEDWNQKKVSLLEQKQTVEQDILEKVAQLLKIPVEAIENMDDEQAVNIISNTFDNGSILNGINYNPSFHPIDKVLQLHEEKIALYERMLKEKDEMMAKLEQYLQKP